MEGMRVTWGSHRNGIGPIRRAVSVFREGLGLLLWLTAWLLTVGVFTGVFVLTGAASVLAVLAWLPCRMAGRFSPKDRS